MPPILFFSVRRIPQIADALQAAEGSSGEEWALRFLLVSCVLALAFGWKWALTLPRKSEVDSLKALNEQTRIEWREERSKREKAENTINLLRLRILRLEMLIENTGGVPPPFFGSDENPES